MKITDRKTGNVCILRISGAIKYENCDKLRDRFKELIAAGERHFVVDMTSVPWLDSMGIGETVACYYRARDRGGKFKLVLVSKAHDLFTLAQLDKVMQIYRDLEEALASFAGETPVDQPSRQPEADGREEDPQSSPAESVPKVASVER
jgi:anti-anti-sigma factor